MFENLKRKLYFNRVQLLFDKALKDGKISEFDEDIYNKMEGSIIAGIPVPMFIRHSRYLFPEGTCYERSLYMFLALDDALLLRGDHKVLGFKYGKGHEGHGWIEIGDYVYDPSLMLKFDRDTYYEIYGVSNTASCDKKTYVEQHNDFFEEHVCHDIDEYKPGGKRRLELGALMIQLRCLSDMLGDERFTNDLNDYLEKVQYDPRQIREERDAAIQKVLCDKALMARISGNE